MANFKPALGGKTARTSMSDVLPSSLTPVTSATLSSVGSTAATQAEIIAVIAYPSIVNPDPQSGDKYVALLLVVDPESQQVLRDLMRDACQQTFRSEELPPGAHDPLRDSNEKNHAGEFAFKHPAFRVPGGLVVRAKTSYQPKCVWGPSEEEIDPSQINGGDTVVVQVAAYGYNNQSKGVGISLGRIWLTGKGETKIERGSGAGANVRRIDRSRLQFAAMGQDAA